LNEHQKTCGGTTTAVRALSLGQTIGNAIAAGETSDSSASQADFNPAADQAMYGPGAVQVSSLPPVNGVGGGAASVNYTEASNIIASSQNGGTTQPASGIETVVVTAPQMTEAQDEAFDWDNFGWWNNVSNADLAPVRNTGILPYVLSPVGRFVGAFDNAVGNGLNNIENGLGNAVMNPVGTATGAYNAAANAVSNWWAHPYDPVQAIGNTVLSGAQQLVQRGVAAYNNGTLSSYAGTVAGNVVVLGAGIATDTEELDGLGEAEAASGVKAVTLAEQLATGPGEAVFWSGRTNGIGGAEVAGNIASSQGGTTLEQLVAAKGVELPVWDANDPASLQAWDDASLAFAQGAQGDVTAVIGQNLRPGNTWERVELPALMANENVTSITTIDPATGEKTVIFQR
jgi:hypothetical protein